MMNGLCAPLAHLPFRVGLRPLSIPGGARVGGKVAGKTPHTLFSAFLPCPSQRSKKNLQSRVNLADSPSLTVEPLFLLAG